MENVPTDWKLRLRRIGIINFATYEEFENWRRNENDDPKVEKRIRNALNNSN